MVRWLQLAAAAAFVVAFAGCGGPQAASGGQAPATSQPRGKVDPAEPGPAPSGKAPTPAPAPSDKPVAEKPPEAAPKTDAPVNPDKSGPAVAVVDGETVTRGELDAFMNRINVRDDERASVEREALDELIKRRLIQKFLAAQNVVPDPEALLDAQLRTYLQKAAAGPKDDAEALALARSIKKELDGGADFAAMAKRYSICPSADQGGDLGDFDPGRMVPAFTTAVQGLKVNATSEPVKTNFGYHIIQRLQLANASAGQSNMLHARHILVQVENANSPQAMQRRYNKLADELRGKARIEIKLREQAAEPPPLPPPPPPGLKTAPRSSGSK